MTVLQEYTEGKTTFLTADVAHYTREKGQPTTDMPVFYNPRMRVNRDLSVLALSAYSVNHPIELICEPLAGSGIRTLRYLNEVEGDFKALLFDANPNAIATANRITHRKCVSSNGSQMKINIPITSARMRSLRNSDEWLCFSGV